MDKNASVETPINPLHYKNGVSDIGKIYLILMGVSGAMLQEPECINAIEKLDAIGWDYCLCNAVKYLWRLGQKGDIKIDAGKAVWYMQRFIDSNRRPLSVNRKTIETAIERISKDLLEG